MEYRTLFPEPVTWKGWYDDEDTAEVLEHRRFLRECLAARGMPKIHFAMASAGVCCWTKTGNVPVLGTPVFSGRQRDKKLSQPVVDGEIFCQCVHFSYLCMEQGV